MFRIFVILLCALFSCMSFAQIPVYGTFQDSVYAVASDSFYNEVSILGAQIATSLNNIELKSRKGIVIRKSIYTEMMNQNSCEEVFHLCHYDPVYLNHAFKTCKMGELSKFIVSNEDKP